MAAGTSSGGASTSQVGAETDETSETDPATSTTGAYESTSSGEAQTCEQVGCGLGELCVADVCVADADSDGVADEVDCDATDAAVSNQAQRECSSGCAPGLELCSEGVWADCNAPTDCDCDPQGREQTRELPCGSCGTQLQACSEQGAWVDQGTCTGQGPCSPNEVADGGACGNLCGAQERTCSDTCQWDDWTCEGQGTCIAGGAESETQACGACGGEQMRVRDCVDSCEWSAWSPWGACTDTGSCTPNEQIVEERECGDCGTESRIHTCDPQGCGLLPPGEWGGCMDEGPCAEGQVDEQTQGWGACDGTQTRSRTCTSLCGWGDWTSWGSQTQCADPGLPSCNSNKGSCECAIDSDCDSNNCVSIAPQWAMSNFCGCADNAPVCPIFVPLSCTDNTACSSGNWCCGYDGTPFSGSCVADGQVC